MVSRTGMCACGGIRIGCEGEPLSRAMCHCQQCQKRTGSTYSAHAYFLKTRVNIEGTTKKFSRSSDSQRTIDFHFRPERGSTMFWEYALRPDAYGIPVGVFADPSFPAPQVAIFVPHKDPWVAIPSGIPQYEGHRPRPVDNPLSQGSR